MKRSWMVFAVTLAAVGGVAVMAADNSARSKTTPAPPSFRPADTSAAGWRGGDPSAGGAARARAAAAAARVRTAPAPNTTVNVNWVWPQWRYPGWYGYYPYGYSGYNPYWGYGYGTSPWGYTPYAWSYPYGYSYGGGYLYGGLPPYLYPGYAYTPFGPVWYQPYPAAAFMPADQLFGPGPIMRMMGVDQWFNQAAPGWAQARPAPAPRARDQDARPRADDAKPPPQPAGAKAVDLAWKLISFGDSYFGNRKFADALDRYRKAAQSAPQVADAWFRQGFANAAMGHYDRAAKAIRRGLEIRPDWASSGFRLDELFGDDTVAKKNLLDALLRVAEADPANADVSLLVGLCYHFDGKPERAAAFLRRAAEVGGNDAAMKNFLAGQQGGGAGMKE